MIEIFAKYSYLLSILISGVYFLRSSHKNVLAKLSLIAFPLSLITGKVLNKVIIDPRPFVVEHIQPLIPHTPDNGFPSDHMLLAATIAAVVFTCNKKLGLVLGLLALASGLARVAAKVHHVQDIAGSFVIALVAVYLSKLLLKCTRAHVAQKTNR